jgi:hemolysin activation/secretion protein
MTRVSIQKTGSAWLLVGLVTMCVAAKTSVANDGTRGPINEAVRTETTTLTLPSVAHLESLRVIKTSNPATMKRFEFVGDTQLASLDFEAALAPYLGKPASFETLAAVRDAATEVLIKAGFINSGARIPSQTLRDGTLDIEIVPGRLDKISIRGTRHFRKKYLRKRLLGFGGSPLNIHQLEDRLQSLAAEPLVSQINARLKPGLNPGDATLIVQITEESPYSISAMVANDTVRSLGSQHLRVHARHRNLIGNRDHLEAYLGKTPGLDEWKVKYALPINRFDTTLFASYRDSASRVVNSDVDLNTIRLESRSRTVSIGIDQPFRFGGHTELILGVRGDVRRAQSEVNGFNFFLTPGEDEKGRARASVLRLSQQLTNRGLNHVLSARSTVSVGLDLFRASQGEFGLAQDVPDGTFVSWLGQWVAITRLKTRYRDAQIIVRADVQITRAPLLAMERFAVGGRRTVRGYHENAIVRDNGAAGSIELRVPLATGLQRGWTLSQSTFVDGGRSWNHANKTQKENLLSVGFGLNATFKDRFDVRFEWGKKLLAIDPRSGGLQGQGIHLQMEWKL